MLALVCNIFELIFKKDWFKNAYKYHKLTRVFKLTTVTEVLSTILKENLCLVAFNLLPLLELLLRVTVSVL